jgi:hypothetical protein
MNLHILRQIVLQQLAGDLDHVIGCFRAASHGRPGASHVVLHLHDMGWKPPRCFFSKAKGEKFVVDQESAEAKDDESKSLAIFPRSRAI